MHLAIRLKHRIKRVQDANIARAAAASMEIQTRHAARSRRHALSTIHILRHLPCFRNRHRTSSFASSTLMVHSAAYGLVQESVHAKLEKARRSQRKEITSHADKVTSQAAGHGLGLLWTLVRMRVHADPSAHSLLRSPSRARSITSQVSGIAIRQPQHHGSSRRSFSDVSPELTGDDGDMMQQHLELLAVANRFLCVDPDALSAVSLDKNVSQLGRMRIQSRGSMPRRATTVKSAPLDTLLRYLRCSVLFLFCSRHRCDHCSPSFMKSILRFPCVADGLN
jgi:hypothetical protein